MMMFRIKRFRVFWTCPRCLCCKTGIIRYVFPIYPFWFRLLLFSLCCMPLVFFLVYLVYLQFKMLGVI